MDYQNDTRSITIKELEAILISYYGSVDRIRGCYINGRWFSIDDILRIVSESI